MSSSIFAESLLLSFQTEYNPGRKEATLNHRHLTGGQDLQAQEGSTELGAQTTLPTPSKEGVSLTGWRLEMGRVGSLHQAPSSQEPACSPSTGPPRVLSAMGDLSERVALDHLHRFCAPVLPPPQSICMRCQELPAGRARSKGCSPLHRNLTPTSVFKDKNLCIKHPGDSEGTV